MSENIDSLINDKNIIDDEPPLILEGEQKVIYRDEKSADFTVNCQNVTVRKDGKKLRMYTVSTANKVTGAVCVVSRKSKDKCSTCNDVLQSPSDVNQSAHNSLINNNEYLLARHWRISTKRWHWEFPRGMGMLGENPVETALRELREETGIKNYSHVNILQKIYADTGILCGDIAVADISIPCAKEEAVEGVGEGAEEGAGECAKIDAERNLETDWELSNLCWFSFDEIVNMIKNNKIDDGITLAAWCIYCNNKR